MEFFGKYYRIKRKDGTNCQGVFTVGKKFAEAMPFKHTDDVIVHYDKNSETISIKRMK